MKRFIAPIFLGAFLSLGFINLRPMQNKSPYEALYFQRLNALDSALRNVVLSVQSEYYTRQSLKLLVHDARLKLKAMDFWLRYLEPVAYKKLNGPLPVEWETEVFEKFEKLYR